MIYFLHTTQILIVKFMVKVMLKISRGAYRFGMREQYFLFSFMLWNACMTRIIVNHTFQLGTSYNQVSRV
jgi:hypothetical protein